MYALMIIVGSVGARAANSAGTEPMPVHCRVIDGGKLIPPGADTICSEVERAIAAAAPNVRYSAEIRVISPSRLATALIVEGRTLPVQNFAVMDRNLSEGTIKRFARALAGVVAGAAKQ